MTGALASTAERQDRGNTMLQKLSNALMPSRNTSLARAFTVLGWAGFWLQVVFGSLPIIVMAYYFIFSRSGTVSRSGLPLVEYLTVVNLLLLLFTLFWSYRYTRLGRRIRTPEQRPSELSVVRTVWIGVMASTVGMLFSMFVMLIEAANLLFYFLKAPQGGIPVVQTSGAEAVHWVSSVDMVSLMALILTLFSELIVLVFSLWLLFQTTLGAREFPQAAALPPTPGPEVPQGAAQL
jgi:hypothetical protein